MFILFLGFAFFTASGLRNNAENGQIEAPPGGKYFFFIFAKSI